MIKSQAEKVVVLLNNATISNGGTVTSTSIDTVGGDYLTLTLFGTTSNNVTNNPSVLKLQESDVTTASTFADITAFVGDGAGGFTIPNSPTATTTAAFARFNVDLKGRKRHLQLVISALTTQTYNLLAVLSREKEMPNTTTEANVAVLVNG
jgi:hypothetical protein